MNQSQQSFIGLISLLEQEAEIYALMETLLGEELEALKFLRASELGELCARKETLALRVKALDESRRLIGDRLGRTFGIAPEDLTVTELCKFAPPGIGERLANVRETLRERAIACKTLNDRNFRAARRGMDLVSNAADYLLKTREPSEKVYAKKGPYAKRKAPSGPSVVSRQV